MSSLGTFFYKGYAHSEKSICLALICAVDINQAIQNKIVYDIIDISVSYVIVAVAHCSVENTKETTLGTVVRLINPTLDEGLDDNVRDLQMAIVRAEIRKRVEDQYGRASRSKARDIGAKYYMCAATVIKFAYGETLKPSSWTIRCMSREAGFQLVLVPIEAALPSGSVQLK